jgi:hypothetical protein
VGWSLNIGRPAPSTARLDHQPVLVDDPGARQGLCEGRRTLCAPNAEGVRAHVELGYIDQRPHHDFLREVDQLV